MVDDEIKQAILSNEETAAIDESIEDEIVVGVWKIEYFHECASTSDSMCSRNYNKNTALSTEAVPALDLVESVVSSMKVLNEGKMVTLIDYRKVWELLASDWSK